jgi:DUF1365 family protein
MILANARRALDALAQAGWRLSFGEVIHRRLRPTAHAFRYPAFHLRAPGHRLDGQRHGNWLFGVNRRALLSLHESDHGDGQAAVMPWLQGLLAQAGITADGPVWLDAFPRVFGYAFKPVSFWFCHRADGALVAIVVEVNNTFGERHCYLLANEPGAPLGAGRTLQAQKVFHVSPFCDVAGTYRFRFMTAGSRSVARVEHHDAEGPLLLTSLSGEHQPLGLRSALRALCGYPLFTLGVIARIHWQAAQLLARRVPFRTKPAPPAHFVTRGSP